MSNNNTADLDFFEKVGYSFGRINESWGAFKLNWTTFLLIWIMPVLLFFLIIPLLILPLFSDSTALSVTTTLLAGAGVLLAVFVFLILAPALTITQLASVRKQSITFEQAFDQSKQYILQYVLAAILGFFIIIGPLLVSLPLVLLIIGLFLVPLALFWLMIAPFFLLLVPYLIVNENLSATKAIVRSYELTKQHWQWVLSVYILLASISIAGSFFNFIPVIGWVVSIGLTVAYYCLPAYVYVHQISSNSKNAPLPSAPAKKAPAKKTKKISNK